MSKLYVSSLLFLLFFCWNVGNIFSQIVVNGPRPVNLYQTGGGEVSVSVSYGYNFWKDKKQKAFPGSSASLSDYNIVNDIIPSIDKFDYSSGVFLGLENKVTSRFGIKGSLFYGKMYTGISTRVDLDTENNKSSFFQIGAYASFTLTKATEKRLQFHWLLGPEVFFAKKDIMIKEYVEKADAEAVDYHYKESAVEGAIVTGLGLSLRITDSFTLYSDGLAGISLPGTGIKVTSQNIGLKYKFR
ncbi:hypothetical protein [Pseudopedobacter beijingensis]|uniref:Outer membrane protein beta-barrel domain-containing protein n=1 Tax=Pseudopedobacter beijingensis TaxID=1207056 RepID=A0ABW4IHV4_9SPHI